MNWQILQKLAKSYHWQTLYRGTKELNGIRLFKNECDLSYIQFMFLRYLEIFNNLYQDLYMKEPFLSEDVIKDDDRVEAYLVWKAENNSKKDSKKTPPKAFDSTIPGAIVFKNKVK